jgi:DNA-directed RNA polymerase subunit RPC12/RpoP
MAGRGKAHGGAAIVGALAVVLALTAGLPQVLRADEEESEPPAGPMGYLRCPECGLEFLAPDRGRPVFCPRCGQKKVVMEFSASLRGAGKGPPPSWPFAAAMGGLVAVLAAALVVLRRLRAPGDAGKQAQAEPEAAPDAAEREKVARWHRELKRRVTRGRTCGD